jgi:hypothetical protein
MAAGSLLADYFANAAQGRARLPGFGGSIEDGGGDGDADHAVNVVAYLSGR